MRKLQTHDVFMGLRVVNAAELQTEVTRIALMVLEKDEKGKEKNFNIKELGINFMLGCLGKLSGTKSEKAIYELLAGPLEIPIEEIEVMEPLELVDKLEEMTAYINKEELKAFFKSVAKLVEKLNS